MKRMSDLRFCALMGLGSLILASAAISAVAQDQPPTTQNQAPTTDQSSKALGDYARQVRKDNGQSKAKPKVFDNDNLPREDKLSVVGEPSPQDASSDEAKGPEAVGETQAEAKPVTSGDNKAPEPQTGQAAGGDKAAASKSPEEEEKSRQAAWKQWQDKVTAQKDQVDLLQRESDVLQREYQVRAAAFYADAGNRLRNQAAWDKQDADYKQQIADKQKAVEDAKQKLDDMQEDARKAGVPSSMREPESQQQ